MQVDNKKTVLELISRLSKFELDLVDASFDDLKDGEKVRTIFYSCFPKEELMKKRASQKNQFSSKFLANTYKYLSGHIPRVLIGANDKTLFEDELIKHEIRFSMDRKLLGRALRICIQQIEKLSLQESFSECEVIFELMNRVLSSGSIEKIDSYPISQTIGLIDNLRKGRNEFELISRIYLIGMIPFAEKSQVMGQLDDALSEWIKARVDEVDIPKYSRKAKVYYWYIRSYLSRMNSDFHASFDYIKISLQHLGDDQWIKESLGELVFTIYLHSLNYSCEVGDSNFGYSQLAILKNHSISMPDQHMWRYYFGTLIVSDTFDDHEIFVLAEGIFNENFDTRFQQLPLHLQIFAVFYLVRLKFKFGNRNKVASLFQIIYSIGKPNVRFEIQVFTRLYEINHMWDLGEFDEVYRLANNLRKILEYSKTKAFFPKVSILVNLFKSIAGKNTKLVKKGIKSALEALVLAPKTEVPENDYFDFESVCSKILHQTSN